ncbi:hypothetical protein A2617_02520 [Candidatus Daviesbacteria bacterium RIFOXYD1_FULL_41_10]|uniref:PDZ domain-containing protein n=2 Tax=Candidatus Daviesiibacteriota TaxID=1752718 RepID=A0A1F5MZA9_9BACT|nr:MAG: Carboxyl-terminal protease [Candidatus Daviesbacteria bacterium GW2011_GWB1_41_5]OGE70726.1 MAG: hypothetical protein A2617_02520 [Candidatus Daviesbacteria bacterium RIFOXYD1_FULL_41_10]
MRRINVTFLLIVVLSFILGWQLGHHDFTIKWQKFKPEIGLVNEAPKDTTLDFKLFWQTWELLGREYIDKKALDPQKLYYGAIQGMVAALGDPYTAFLPPKSQKATKEQLSGLFEGVGIQLGFNKEKRLVVVAPLAGTPAAKAGVKPGDIILEIDKKDTVNMSLPDAVSLIRGPKGTDVTLTIFREGNGKPVGFKLTRDEIIVKSVELETKLTPTGKKIALLKVSSFGEKTAGEWDGAVSTALSNAPRGVIVDVRNNPGGFLEGAVYLSSEFLEGGVVVMQENAEGERTELKVNRTGKMLKMPLIVLINKGSASASEIFAGAVQDYGRGKLIGEQSFGKGTIQSSQDLPESTGIHITTAKWLTPKGRWIHDTGLTPDEKVEPGVSEDSDLQLERALKLFDESFVK